MKDAKEQEILDLNTAADAASESLFNCNARIAALKDRERFYRNVKGALLPQRQGRF